VLFLGGAPIDTPVAGIITQFSCKSAGSVNQAAPSGSDAAIQDGGAHAGKDFMKSVTAAQDMIKCKA